MKSGARTVGTGEERNRVLDGFERREPLIRPGGLHLSRIKLQNPDPQLRLLPSHSRRDFLNAAIAALAAPAFWLMHSLASRTESLPEKAESTVTVPWSATHNIRFYDRIIVINRPSGVAVFSATCPHLGCRINRADGSELLCPCHGSRFNQQGQVVNGPATHNLRPLSFALDRTNAFLRVTLEG